MSDPLGHVAMGLSGNGAGRKCGCGWLTGSGEYPVVVRSPLVRHRRVLDLLASIVELFSGVPVVDVAARFCWCARHDTLVERA